MYDIIALINGSIINLYYGVIYSFIPYCFSVDSAFDSTYKVNLLNYHDGNINWVPPGIFKISCKLDIYWFPFDRQSCVFKVYHFWCHFGDNYHLFSLALGHFPTINWRSRFHRLIYRNISLMGRGLSRVSYFI